MRRITAMISMVLLVSTAFVPETALAWTRTCVHGTTAQATSLIPGKTSLVRSPEQLELYLTGEATTTLLVSVPITFLSKIRKVVYSAKRVGANVQIARIRVLSAHNLVENFTGAAAQLTGSEWETKTISTTNTSMMYSSVNVAIDVKATQVSKLVDTYRFTLSQVCIEFEPQIGFP